MQVHIQTERLILRTIAETDVEGIFALDSDPAVHEFLGNKPIKTLAQAQEVVAYIRKQYKTHGIGRFAVICKHTEDFIGWSGLKYEDGIREYSYYDLGYRLRKQYWGKGIATETAIASLKYGFEALKLEKIAAGADIQNIGSNRVLQKAGFKLIETFEFQNAPHNWYELTKDEWASLEA